MPKKLENPKWEHVRTSNHSFDAFPHMTDHLKHRLETFGRNRSAMKVAAPWVLPPQLPRGVSTYTNKLMKRVL